MPPIPSTAEILALKMLNRSVDEVWVNWAVDMLMAGFDTENLVILAGISTFDNQFELAALTDKVFAELQLNYSDKEKVVKRYASYIITQCLAQQETPLTALRKLESLCCELEYERDLYDFYRLYFAKTDLLTDQYQYYWPDADRSNIDTIITNYFTQWLAKNPVVF